MDQERRRGRWSDNLAFSLLFNQFLVCAILFRSSSGLPTENDISIIRFDQNRLAGGNAIDRVRGYGADDNWPDAFDLPFGNEKPKIELPVPPPGVWYSPKKDGRGCRRSKNDNGKDSEVSTESILPCVDKIDKEFKVDDEEYKDFPGGGENEAHNDKNGGITGSYSSTVAPTAASQIPILADTAITTNVPSMMTSPPTTVIAPANETVCSNFGSQNGPKSDWSNSRSKTFTVIAQVDYRKDIITVGELKDGLEDMRTPMAMWLANCRSIAMGYLFDESSGNGRALQEFSSNENLWSEPESDTLHAEWSSWKSNGACSPTALRLTCESFQSEIMLLTNEIFKEKMANNILEAFKTFDVLLLNRDGVVSIQMDKTKIRLLEDEAMNNDINPQKSATDRYIGVIIGFIAASLAVILSLLCICRHRLRLKKRSLDAKRNFADIEDDSSMSEDSTGASQITEDTSKSSVYATSIASAVSMPSRSLEGRDIQDEPSQKNPWITEEALFWLNHPIAMDTDMEYLCSAATCKTCEIRRQWGISLNAQSGKGRPRLKPRTTTPTTVSYTSEQILTAPRSPCEETCSFIYLQKENGNTSPKGLLSTSLQKLDAFAMIQTIGVAHTIIFTRTVARRFDSVGCLFRALLILFSAVTVFSLDSIEPDAELNPTGEYTMYPKNRLSGGISVRTITKSKSRKRSKKATRGITPQTKMPRNSKKQLLARLNNGRPENPEDWFFLSSFADEAGKGCRKLPKRMEELNKLRAINAPPSAWISPSPVPPELGCEGEPNASSTIQPTTTLLPNEIAPSTLNRTSEPTPSIPWIDETPADSTFSPTKAPSYLSSPTRTGNPTVPWIDPDPAIPISPTEAVKTPKPSESDGIDPIPSPVAFLSETDNPTISPSPTDLPIVSLPSEESLVTPTTLTELPTVETEKIPTLESSPTNSPSSIYATNVPTLMVPPSNISMPSYQDVAPADSLSPSSTSDEAPLEGTQNSSSPDAVSSVPSMQPSSNPSSGGLDPATLVPTISTDSSFMPTEVYDLLPSSAGATSEPSFDGAQQQSQEVCQSIVQQQVPSRLTDTDPTTFGVTVDVQYSIVTSDFILSFLDSMNIPVALWIAGCKDEALKYVSSDSKRRRSLQDREELMGTVEYAQCEPWALDESCVPSGVDVTCDTFGSRINIYENGTIGNDLLRSSIASALDTFSPLVTDQLGVQSMQVNDIVLLNDFTGSGIIGGDETERQISSVNTTVMVGAIATGLGVFLLTMIGVVFSQRRQRATAMSHTRFDDELDDSHPFHPELVSSDSGICCTNEYDNESHQEYQTTIISLGGRSNQKMARDGISHQSNTISFEEWAPFGDTTTNNSMLFLDTGEDFFWSNPPPGRQQDHHHQCSAATCEVCELRRQQGIRLAGRSSVRDVQLQAPPSPERLPTQYDPNRWFISGDTVQL
ncbi:hypothetical protein IV203_017937 [Nitzschia inconspicua]|uniref:Transmembrane protein n=1 Tax=Nitzschia inconspicua TaxID=303405 RepID=A0A9K3M0J8_9STRA|nr:hypothetical protein IV203_017937 [Nitzschia inconspicua]